MGESMARPSAAVARRTSVQTAAVCPGYWQLQPSTTPPFMCSSCRLCAVPEAATLQHPGSGQPSAAQRTCCHCCHLGRSHTQVTRHRMDRSSLEASITAAATAAAAFPCTCSRCVVQPCRVDRQIPHAVLRRHQQALPPLVPDCSTPAIQTHIRLCAVLH